MLLSAMLTTTSAKSAYKLLGMKLFHTSIMNQITMNQERKNRLEAQVDFEDDGLACARNAAHCKTAEDVSLLIKQISMTKNLTFYSWARAVEEVLMLTRHIRGSVSLGVTRPFPGNPDFLCKPPLSDKFKSFLYAKHKSDPKFHTIRRLAKDFQLPTYRMEGIIRLKKREEEQVAKGMPLKTNYCNIIEGYLGALDDPTGTYSQNDLSYEECISKISPKFVLLPENESIDYQQAADLLGHKKITFYRPPEHTELVDEDTNDLFIRKDVYETNRRWRFIFFDKGSQTTPKHRLVVIREKDGVLRHATRNERLKEAKRVYGKGYKELIEI